MKGRVVGDHFSTESGSAFRVDRRGQCAVKGGIVVRGRAEDVPRFVEAESPRVVVKLIEEFHFRSIGAKAENAGAKLEVFPSDIAFETGISDRAIDPVVESVTEVGRSGVRVADSPTGEEDFFPVGFVVAVLVFQKQKVRGLGHDDAVVPESERGRNIEAFGKDSDFVGFAVSIGVLENLDGVVAGAVANVIWIINRLGDPEAAAFVPGEIDRIHDHGIGREEFESEVRRSPGVVHGVLRPERMLIEKWFRAFLVVRDVVALFVGEGSAFREEGFVGGEPLVSDAPEDAAFQEFVEFRKAPDALVMS